MYFPKCWKACLKTANNSNKFFVCICLQMNQMMQRIQQKIRRWCRKVLLQLTIQQPPTRSFILNAASCSFPSSIQKKVVVFFTTNSFEWVVKTNHTRTQKLHCNVIHCTCRHRRYPGFPLWPERGSLSSKNLTSCLNGLMFDCFCFTSTR